MLDDREHIAAILQARMSWPEAERCAEALHQAGVRTLDRMQAIEVLKQQLPPSRASGAAGDLVMAGLVKADPPRPSEED